MIRLGVELSLAEGSVSVERDGEILSQTSWNRPKLHAEAVYPQIERALKLAGASRKEIGEVVVSSGPGSFTGVRLSVTVGKAFKAVGVKVLCATTLDALAWGYQNLGFSPVPLLPARRGKVYAKVEDRALDLPLKELLESLKEIKNPLIIYKGQVELPKEVRAFKELTPLSTKLLSLPKELLTPLKFHYIRDHDAKPQNPSPQT